MAPRKPTKKKTQNKSLGKKQARAVKSIVKKTLKSENEWKNHQVYAVANVATGTTIVDTCAVPQGDTSITRDGDQLMASSLHLKYDWEGADSYNHCRLMVFQWYPDTTPTGADILDSSVVPSSNAHMYPYNTKTAESYKVLYDTVRLCTAVSVPVTNTIQKKIRIPRPKIKFSAGTTTGTNKVYLLFVTDSAAAPNPNLTYHTKLNYRDP